MRALLHEFKVGWKLIATYAAIIIMIFFALLSGINVQPPGTNNGPPSANVAYNYYFDNGAFNFEAFAYNAQGSPAPTNSYFDQVRVSIAEAPGYAPYNVSSGYSDLTGFQNRTIQFGNSGWSNTTFSINSSVNYYFLRFIFQGYGLNGIFSSYAQTSMTSGGSGPYYMTTVRSHSSYYQNRLLLLYFGNSSQPESGKVTLYYSSNQSALNGFNYGKLNYSELSKVSSYSGYNELRVNVIPELKSSEATGNIIFFLVSSNGTVVSAGDFGPMVTQPPPGTGPDAAIQSSSPFLSLFVPFLAAFLGYVTYGSPRTSGALESTITRRVERHEPIVGRYLSNAAAVTISLAISTAILYYYVLKAYGIPPGTGFMEETFFGYLAAGLSFLSLSYLFSHLTKNGGGLIAGIVILTAVFAIFWLLIPAVIANSAHVSTGSTSYIRIFVDTYYLSPATLPQLIFTYSTKTITTYMTTSINTAFFGITAANLIVACLVWVLVPIIGAVYLAVKRD